MNFAETFPPKTIADKSDEIVVASGQIHHPPHKQPSPGLSSMVWIWSQCLACTWRGRAQRPHGILALTKEFRDPGHVPTPVPRPGSRAAGSPPRAGCTFFAATSPAADKNFQSRLLWPAFPRLSDWNGRDGSGVASADELQCVKGETTCRSLWGSKCFKSYFHRRCFDRDFGGCPCSDEGRASGISCGNSSGKGAHRRATRDSHAGRNLSRTIRPIRSF